MGPSKAPREAQTGLIVHAREPARLEISFDRPAVPFAVGLERR